MPTTGGIPNHDLSVGLAPQITDTGLPVCPLCARGLTYVERVIERREYPVTKMVTEPGGKTVPTYYFPEVHEATLTLTEEVLSRRVECRSLECDYVVPCDILGETDFS